MNPGHEGIEEKIGYLQEKMVSQKNEIVEENEEDLCEGEDSDNNSIEDQNHAGSDTYEAQGENGTSNFKVSETI